MNETVWFVLEPPPPQAEPRDLFLPRHMGRRASAWTQTVLVVGPHLLAV